MKNFFRKQATLRNIFLLGVLTILFNIAMGYAFGSIEGEILDVQLFYSSEQAYQHISAYNEGERALYIKTTLLLDYLYPWIYSLFLGLILFRISGKHKLSILPFFILLLDYAENTAIIILLSRYPLRLELLASAAGMLTLGKWLMVLFCIVLILWMGALRFVSAARKRNR